MKEKRFLIEKMYCSHSSNDAKKDNDRRHHSGIIILFLLDDDRCTGLDREPNKFLTKFDENTKI